MLIISMVLSSILWYFISTSIHELGHAFVVRKTNNKVIEARLGTGKKNTHLIKLWDLEIKKYFYLPGSRCVWEFSNLDNFRRDGVLISLGGSVANFLTLIPLGFAIYFSLMINFNTLSWFFMCFFGLTLIQTGGNLIPVKNQDGYHVKKYLFSTKESILKQQRLTSINYDNEE